MLICLTSSIKADGSMRYDGVTQALRMVFKVWTNGAIKIHGASTNKNY
jgi:hypothetical protein